MAYTSTNKSFKKFISYCVIGSTVLSLVTLIIPKAVAIPPELITKKFKNIKIEIKQASVVVGGDPASKPTGWNTFKDDGTSLAFVKFQIRIFRNGKLETSDSTGAYSYRNGDLPELVEIKNLDRDKELEIRIHFRNYDGAARYRVLVEHLYDWDSNTSTYKNKVNIYSPG
jgi:hypothetical protein